MEVEGEWGTILFKAKTYKVMQFHFHQPSEHTFDGNRYDMEMHIVHQNKAEGIVDADDYLVLALYFNIGPETNLF